jgi:chromosome partitioning protein
MGGPPGSPAPSSVERSGAAAAEPAPIEPGGRAKSPAGDPGRADKTLSAPRPADVEWSLPADGPAGVGAPVGADPPGLRGPVVTGRPAGSAMPDAGGSVGGPAGPPSQGSQGWPGSPGSVRPVGAGTAKPAGPEEPSEMSGSREPGGSTSSETTHTGPGLAPVAKESRGPELIEAGMVYVDPDPEIGSPPKAAGWGSQPATRRGQVEGPGSPSDAELRAEEIASGRSGAGVAASSPEPGLGTTSSDTDAVQGAESESREGGEHRGQAQVATTADPAVNASPEAGTSGIGAGTIDPAEASAGQQPTSPADALARGLATPETGATAGATSQLLGGDPGSLGKDVQSGPGTGAGAGSGLASVRWNEPSLPMALPPGMAPSDPGELGAARNEDLEGELLPQPDPTWPRLFGSRVEAQASSGTDGIPTPPDQPAAPRHGTAGEQSNEAPGEHPWLERQGGIPAPKHGSPSVGLRQGFVDVTTGEPRIGGEPIPPGHRQGGIVGPSAVAGVDPIGDSSTSTVTRPTEAGEVDLRDMPTSPHSVDVSRETSAGGGEGMDPGLEDETVEDEAAIAVREAVSRAAAEAGVDVSRETSPLTPGTPIDELSEEPSIDREAAARSARVTFRIHRGTLNGDRRVLAVANQKGGVGKSTTAVNIGAYLALAGARVLVVDLDPQGNASTGLGLDHREIEPSIYDVLTGDVPPATAIRATGVADLHILPSTIDLAGAEVELVSAMSRETRLRRALESIDHQYDTILIDCPPSLGLLTVNALAAADELLIPIQCEYYALEGLGQLLRNVELVRANLNPELRIGGIVLTMYDGRTRLALQVVDEVRKHFTDVVYQTVVPRSVRLSEAPGYGLPIALYDPLSRGGIAYRDLTFELAERSGLLAPTGEGAS